MQVHVGVEVDPKGQAMAWVGELPGCYTRGRTAQEALDKVPLAVYEYCVWLQAHGEELEPPGHVEIADVETVQVTSDLGQAESTGLFTFDLHPFPGTPALALRAAHFARADLLELLPSLGPDLPRGDVEGEARTLSQTLDHILLMDVLYTIRMLDPTDLSERDYLLRAIRDACLPVIARWADEADPAPVRVYTEPTGGEGPTEAWTGYKALRRHVWHDRIHYRNLARRRDRQRAAQG
jgi:predicted RNase H-like HicB family nuclease